MHQGPIRGELEHPENPEDERHPGGRKRPLARGLVRGLNCALKDTEIHREVLGNTLISQTYHVWLPGISSLVLYLGAFSDVRALVLTAPHRPASPAQSRLPVTVSSRRVARIAAWPV